jgi:hypothetical protein
LAGDLNVAHKDIDIYEPKGHDKTAGFTPQEREWFDGFLQRGYVDLFRHLHPELQQFSFFGYRFNARARGRGWRLDYFVIPEADLKEGLVRDCIIETTGNYSDHLPVVLTLDRGMIVGPEDANVSEAGITVLNTGEVFTGDMETNVDGEEEREAAEVSGQAPEVEVTMQEPLDGTGTVAEVRRSGRVRQPVVRMDTRSRKRKKRRNR